MLFTINAYKLLLGFSDTYRLRLDGTWTKQEDTTSVSPIMDFTFPTYDEAKDWLAMTGTVLINSEKASTIPSNSGKLLDDSYQFEIIVHRFSKPKNSLFTKKQLAEVLLHGDDDCFNSLVIDYDGFPRLVPLHGRLPSNLGEYPVRFETFAAGNGYVGTEPDAIELEQTYLALLEGWEYHLETGCSTYRDYATREKTEAQLLRSIDFMTGLLL